MRFFDSYESCEWIIETLKNAEREKNVCGPFARKPASHRNVAVQVRRWSLREVQRESPGLLGSRSIFASTFNPNISVFHHIAASKLCTGRRLIVGRVLNSLRVLQAFKGPCL